MKLSEIGISLKFSVTLFFISAVFFFFFGIYFGLDFTDSFYHLNQAIQPVGDTYLYPSLYSSIIIREIIGFLGKEIITLRYVDSFILFFSFLIPFLFFKITKSWIEVLIYIAFGLILYSPFALNILGYDTLSIFIVSLIFTVSVMYLRKPKTLLMLILAILTAIAILIRLPNLILIFILGAIMVIRETKYFKEADESTNLANPLFFIFLVFLGVFGGYFFYYNSWSEFTSATGNSGSHHLVDLLTKYFRDGIKFLICIFFIISTYILYKIHHKRSTLIVYICILLAYFLFLGIFKVYEAYKFNYGIFLLALSASIVGLHIFYNREKLSGYKQLVLYLFILFLFVNPFGSDTGLLKGYSMFLLLPFILSTIDLGLKRFWFVVMLAIIPFTVITKILSPYQDMNLLTHDTTLNHNLLSSIKTKKVRAEYLLEIDKQVKDLKTQSYKIYFYGNKSHIFEYLYPDNSFGIRAFWRPIDDSKYLPQIKREILNKPKVAIFLVPNYPESPIDDFGLMEDELLKMNFKKTVMNEHVVFLKN